MTLFTSHTTLVVLLPPGDRDRFLDATVGPADLVLPATHIAHTAAWLRTTGFQGLPTDPTEPPSAHALLGAHRHVAGLMAGRDAGWWRTRRQALAGTPIPPDTPLTTSCVCQMVQGCFAHVPRVWFSIPRLLVWDGQPRPEAAYDRVSERLDADGVTLFHSPTAMDQQIRMALFATPDPLRAHTPRGVLLPDGWTVAAFPFDAPTDHRLSLLHHMAPLFPHGGGAVVVNASTGTRVVVEAVLDGRWDSIATDACFGPEHHHDPFHVADYAWKRIRLLGHTGTPAHARVVEGLSRLCRADTVMQPPSS